MPVPAHPVFYEALDEWNLTSFSRLLKPKPYFSTAKGFIAMDAIYLNPSAPVTLFIPTNEAVDDHIRPPNGVCRPLHGDDCVYFITYHAAPGMWYFDEPNAKYTHTIIPTAQYPQRSRFKIDKGNWSPYVLVTVTERDATGALKTTFRNQNVSIIGSMPESPNNNIKLYLLDGVLQLPPTYQEFLKSDRDARTFQELRSAASGGGVEFETSTGFTAFIPTHQSQLLQKAQKLFPTQASLSVFYSNHIIPNHIVWSSGFKNGYWRSEALYPYEFHKPEGGPWTISLNGVKATVTTADVALANGVVHFIDTPFWNPTPDVEGMSLASETPAGTTKAPFVGSMLGSITGSSVTVALLAIMALFSIWLTRKAAFWRRCFPSPGRPAWQRDLDEVSEVHIPADAFAIDPLGTSYEERRRSSATSGTQGGSDVADDGDHEEREIRFRVANPGPSLADDASSISTLSVPLSQRAKGLSPSPLSQDIAKFTGNQLISIEETTPEVAS